MGEMVSYPTAAGTGKGYLALPSAAPAGAQAGPAVVVIQEHWGLVEHITSLADRFAGAGFLALAPDLYHGAHATEPDEARKLAMGLAMDSAAGDIAGAAAYLVERAETNGRIGAVGFCMGGSLALWSATLSDDIQATVGFYPAIPWERMSPDWSNYRGKTAVIHCSEADGTSAAPDIQTARNCIEAAGGRCILYDYPGTRHAFFNDDRPEVYDGSAAASAWARTLEVLRSRLA
jgi:carboxymethylenebutenolidase